MNKHLENLTKAQQCAELLVSDVRGAHRDACIDQPNAADNLLESALLPLISEAGELHDKLEALRSAFERAESGEAVAA